MPPEESGTQDTRDTQESQNYTEETEETGTTGQESGGGNSQQAQAGEEVTDVTLDVPTLNLDEAHLQVANLRAKISLQAELAEMVKINVGVDAFLEKVELDLNGLEAQAMLKANLENVREILVRTLQSLDNNPDLVDSLAQMVDGSGKELEGVAGDLDDESEDRKEPGDEDNPEIEATDAARSKAEDLGVDLSQLEGTGSGGRIIARDVQQAANRR